MLNHIGETKKKQKTKKTLRESRGAGSQRFRPSSGPGGPPSPSQRRPRSGKPGRACSKKALSHALGGPSPERLGGAESRARQPSRPLSARRPAGAGSRSTPGHCPGRTVGRPPGRARLCARRSGVLPPPRRPGPRHLPCGARMH